MASPLVLRFDVKDDGSIALKKIRDNVQGLGHDLDSTTAQAKTNTSSMATLRNSVILLGTAYAGLSVMKKVISDGIAYNRMMEEQANGIRALIVATSENVSQQGKALTLQEKYTLATREAKDMMAQLNEINAQTPHTLGQTAQIYKAMFANMKQYGAATSDTVEITKLVSIAAGSAGIEFQQVLASVDGLANGTFLANSEMGRFLTSIGLAPAKLKALAKEGKSVDYIREKLAPFNVEVDTLDVAMSNLENSWNQASGQLTKDIFSGAKAGANSLSSVLKNISDEDIAALTDTINAFAIAAVQSVGFAVKAFVGFKNTVELAGTAVADIMLWMTEWDGDYEKMSKMLWENTQKNVSATQPLIDGINEGILATKKALEASAAARKTLADAGGGTTAPTDATVGKKGGDTSAADALTEATEKNLKKQLEYIDAIKYENELRANGAGGIEYLLELRQRGLEVESEIGQQLIEQLSTKDQLGGTEEAIAQMEALKEAYTQLRLSTYNEEDLVAQFEAEAMLVEEAFANKLIAEEERKAMLEELTKQHEEKVTAIMSKEAKKREKFEKASAVGKTKMVLGELQSLTAGVANHNKALFNLNKAAALADAAINIPTAVLKTMAAYPGPVGIALGAVTAAAGLAQLAAIMSTSFGGGGGSTVTPSGGGGAAVTPGVAPSAIGEATAPRAAQEVKIDLGDSAVISTQAVRELIDRISEEISDGYKLEIA